ncbi:2-polyprenyl-3-methyl-6-methoxy-1,4-benzoquinone monooxygenase [Legionella sp. CNM-4043-24]|uniref:2-polyprenyl-3-methyl-6-methoxy-1,4-benzoquinone monooxygenase n=1 Tax=Legionella sp. CNM-4043-24 TaxID=3421646 RepID=UPI00403A81B4
MRKLSLIDRMLNEVDTALRTLLPPQKRISNRPSPAQNMDDAPLSAREKKHAAGLMRVNHAGEVCAQALYQGQALTAHLTRIRKQMAEAAAEEVDHLAWCEQRLQELDSKPGLLNPVWYFASFTLGALAGLAGDKVSLGFVAETEDQVSAHLQKHLRRLPAQDEKSRTILMQMQADEEHHADQAREAGAIPLPEPVKKLMSMTSQLMTQTSYHI